MKFVEYIAQTEDLIFIFMPHPKYVDATIDEILLPDAKKLLAELHELENVYIDRAADYRNSLVNADAIIVDRSAVMVEAGIKGVPVLYMYNDNYHEPMTMPIERLLDMYYQGTTATEMIDFCNMQKRGEDCKRQQRLEAFANCVPYTDGKCAERIKDELIHGMINAKDSDYKVAICHMKSSQKFLIFGTECICEYCMEAFGASELEKAELVGFVDNNKNKQGCSIYGKRIMEPQQLLKTDFDFIVIATDVYYRGYEDVYEDEDYDWDRYYSDDDYASGVDDAIDELDW